MGYFEKNNNSLIFRNSGETVEITPWGENSLRIRASFMGDIKDGEIALLTPEKATPAIVIDEKTASITNGKIKAEADAKCGVLRITFKNQRGEILLREINPDNCLFKSPRQFKSLTGDTFCIKQYFDSDANEKIYGMGQYPQEILNLKGCNLELAQRNSQVSIPFYMSDKGYGFLWHNAAVGEVHFGTNTTEWLAGVSRQIDYWITAGDTPGEITDSYTKATGRPSVMPEYGLGYWQCKLRYYNQEQVIKIAREHKERGIPVDVFVIDYYHWPRCGDFRFDEEFFPNPKEMFDELKKLGMTPMVSIWPHVDTRSENYEEMKQKGLLVKNNTGTDVHIIFHGNNVFIDSTNPKTRRYVWEKIKKNYYDLGAESFWLDANEPEFIPYDFERYRYHIGSVPEVGNVYPREHERLFYEGLKSEGKDSIVNLARSAWVGSQKYGTLVWSGDVHSTYEDFRRQICAGINIGIAGIPWWTNDIGGFSGGDINDESFKELLIRWFQYAAFLPVMRMHGLRMPYKEIVDKSGEHREITGADNEIWSYGEENYKIMLKFIKIREKMRDYTRSLMQQAHENGSPVIRGLFYEFPDDKKCWDIKDQYMFGGDILVAPVCYKHAVSRKVYLPKGAKWTDARSGKVYDGGFEIEVEAPIDTIPIFLRDGKQEYLIGEI